MKSQVEWQDEPELFEAVVGALDLGITIITENEEIEAEVYSYDEQGPYGERGHILICYAGRRFSLDLHELS